VCTAQGM